MRVLKNIDVAFIPMNLPCAMTPEEAADAVRAFATKVVYSYHAPAKRPSPARRSMCGSRDWYY